jgi:hypothetical protein
MEIVMSNTGGTPPPVIQVGSTCYYYVSNTLASAGSDQIDCEFSTCSDCAASAVPSNCASSTAAVANICDGTPDCTGHTGSPGVAPSLVLKIGDPSGTYAGGSITWCGKTWTQAQINANNFEQCACPTRYRKLKNIPTPTASTATNIEDWDHTSGPVDLFLARDYHFAYYAGPVNYIKYRVWQMQLQGVSGTSVSPRDKREVKIGRFGNPTSASYTNFYNTFNVGVLNPTITIHDPTENNYSIVDPMFGTHTNSNGLEFTWSRGVNW